MRFYFIFYQFPFYMPPFLKAGAGVHRSEGPLRKQELQETSETGSNLTQWTRVIQIQSAFLFLKFSLTNFPPSCEFQSQNLVFHLWWLRAVQVRLFKQCHRLCTLKLGAERWPPPPPNFHPHEKSPQTNKFGIFSAPKTSNSIYLAIGVPNLAISPNPTTYSCIFLMNLQFFVHLVCNFRFSRSPGLCQRVN